MDSYINMINVILENGFSLFIVNSSHEIETLESEQVVFMQELVVNGLSRSTRMELLEFKEHASLVQLELSLIFLLIVKFRQFLGVSDLLFTERNIGNN